MSFNPNCRSLPSRVPAASPNSGLSRLLLAPPPVVASRKLARLKILNAEASNFRLKRSLSLKVLPSVISPTHCPGAVTVLRPRVATQCPGRVKVFRRRVPTQARQGADRVGKPAAEKLPGATPEKKLNPLGAQPFFQADRG